MERYANRGGDSNVVAYEMDPSSIQVQFGDGSVYLYTYAVTGVAEVERMKELAQLGQGLNSYIGKNVRKRYASKIR